MLGFDFSKWSVNFWFMEGIMSGCRGFWISVWINVVLMYTLFCAENNMVKLMPTTKKDPLRHAVQNGRMPESNLAFWAPIKFTPSIILHTCIKIYDRDLNHVQVFCNGCPAYLWQLACFFITHPAMDASSAREHPKNVFKTKVLWKRKEKNRVCTAKLHLKGEKQCAAILLKNPKKT